MDCKALIENFVNDRDETVPNKIGQSLITKELSLVDLIVDLGDYFQSTQLSQRSAALTLVAKILEHLPTTFLENNEIHHLILFVSAKMSDHQTLVQSSIQLFRILAKQSNIADVDCVTMIRSIFSEVYVQSFSQATRYNVFVILLYFLLYRLDVVRQLGSDFVCNFIQAMDGERDPRNLVVCFQCLQYVVKYLDFEPYKEELFEVVACYFPMQYTPKATNNDSEETITHEQLSLSLRNVLASTRKFAAYCVPMLIEKLESDISSSRLAAMDLFIHCIDEYDASDIGPHLIALWNLFSKQGLCPENQDIEIHALRSITTLLKLIGKSVQDDETDISTKKFVDRAIRLCENFLKEINSKQAWPAAKVLHAVARASPSCSSLIWSHIIPLLMKQFEVHEQVNHKKIVFDIITYFFQPTGIRALTKLPMDLSNELWIFISTNMTSFTSHCLSLISNLLQLDTIPGQVLADDLTKLILQENISEELKIKLSTVLKLLSASASFDRICTSILTNLIHTWTATKTTPSNSLLEYCIDLCYSFDRCEDRLERFFFPSEQFIRLLPNLFQYMSKLYILTKLYSPLNDLLLTSIMNDDYSKMFCAKCGAIADESWKVFIENFIETTLLDDSIWHNEKKANLLSSIYFIGNLKRELFQNELELIFDQINEKLIEKIFNESSNESLCYFYGNLVNKLASRNKVIDQAQLIIKQCKTTPSEKHVYLWTIIVKALTLYRPDYIQQNIETLISWMNEKSNIGDLACESLKTLTNFNEQPLLLSSEADCIIHPMVKQIIFMNLFSHIKPLLAKNELLPNQMNALVDLLSSVPKSIVQDQIISLLPILVRALTSVNESVWLPSLNSICDLIKSNPNSVSDYTDTLLSRLTILATYKNDMNVRIMSLKCLQYLTSLPIHKIEPHRRHIIHVLKACLDDHKRLVRKQAVETQMLWCLLNV